MTNALQETEDRVSEALQERHYATTTITRLEENLRQRGTSDSDFAQRIRAVEREAENLREELSRARREHTRAFDTQARELEEARSRETSAQSQMEALLKEKVQGDVSVIHMTDRTTGLQDEVDKLRRQLHDLQQSTAAKDMRIVQLAKQLAQEKDDKEGLNIALDSKQQEVEMVCYGFLVNRFVRV